MEYKIDQIGIKHSVAIIVVFEFLKIHLLLLTSGRDYADGGNVATGFTLKNSRINDYLVSTRFSTNQLNS